ncbi:thiamine biosynthetic bifunctional enzyme [Dentipellis sp. KUC8613]|nr:thiamine biosynthetic bifunctional enzyme [Dentipellis sp. KUC8613]
MTERRSEKPAVDYSVYLVTGRDLLPPGKGYLESLREAIDGGVTLVQVREKTAETSEFLEIAQQTVELCRSRKVPVLIDDRIDIALASRADGVHLGQTDMPVAMARSLLPPNAIIGMTCTTSEHVRQAILDKVDYVGLGAVYGTATKDVSAPGKIRGVKGVREMLGVLEGTGVKSVAIGGIKSTNLLRVLHGSVTPTGHALDGVAVVSDIVASSNPRASAERLALIFRSWAAIPRGPKSFSVDVPDVYLPANIVNAAADLVARVRHVKPLVHQLTNNVVKTQSANATIALGGSPIMAAAAQEQGDLARIPGGMLINFGTVEEMDGMLAAGFNANLNRKPVIFDPVGIGATTYRQSCAEQLLSKWQPTVIKGNAAEIGALIQSEEVKSQGVDSLGSGFKNPEAVVRSLAQKERCIVVLSGPIDYISDGSTVIRLLNGHPLLGQITGAGCMLGTAVATFCGTQSVLAERQNLGAAADGVLARGDMLTAAAAGVLALTIASEKAAQRGDVHGPGTFLPALIDSLADLTPETVQKMAKVEVDVENK